MKRKGVDSAKGFSSTETRGQRLWQVLRERRDTEPLSLERARLVTASYRETEGLPTILRRAKAFEKIVAEIPIYIDEGQLLAGDFASRPMAAEWFPEYTVEWVLKEVNDGRSPYMVGETEVSLMKEICDYWKDKAARETFYRYLGEEEVKSLYEVNEQGSWIFAASMEAQTEKGWNVPDYPKAIRLGLSGILAEVEEELRTTRPLDGPSFDKTCFLEALSIALRAGIRYAHRYAAVARELSKKTKGERKKELQRIAAICERVPEEPARSFHEALQTVWFCHVLTYWDTRTVGVSFGRVDQYLYPYYAEDIQKGRMSREEAVELLECFRVKMAALRNFNNAYVREATAGETQFHNCTLGGQTADGKDATNDLSYLWLEAAARTRTPHPTLSVRWHERLSPDFAMKAAEVCRIGLGYPAWFGDKGSIAYLLEKGATLEEARDYAVAGCVLHVVPHKTAATWPTIVSMAKVLEVTLYNGVDPRLGKQVGLTTGSLEDFETYDALYEAFKKQVKHFLARSTSYLNKVRLFRAERLPDLFVSSLFDDCIKRGESVGAGGSRYQHSSMYLIPVGVTDVADSLAALKKRVFEEGLIGKGELLKALKTNFEGKEDLRQMLLSAPKYGNDDDYVDEIVAGIYSWLCKTLDQIEGPYGSRYANAPHSLSFHGAAGRKVGALPSGRLSGVSLADGAVSPCQGADHKGPTAVVNSAGKVDHLPMFGTLFNMKFHPSALKSREDLTKFLALIRTYFDDYGGKHLQFNVIDRKTLMDAQGHPDRHRNLVVRVAGYSALWVELDRKIQDEIIARTEHTV
jgi:pyruvate formate-lyase/glycerol dehydratase family glycyl radical enzyme